MTPIEEYLSRIPESERPAALADLRQRMDALPPKAEPTADDVYNGYAKQNGAMIVVRNADRTIPGLMPRLRALADRRGIPLCIEPSPDAAHARMLDRARARGFIPGGDAAPRIGNDTISKTDSRAFLANLEQIAAGKVRVA